MIESSLKVVSYCVKGRVAIVRLNKPNTLNALSSPEFHQLADLLQEINARPDIVVTILTGSGKFFSAGADIRAQPEWGDADAIRRHLQKVIATNLYLSHTLSTHSKILIAALNGPAVGGAAAIAAFADFVYAAPDAYLLLPFASLGLVAELGTSRTIAQRLGRPLAHEAMLMGRKITADRLEQCGFITKIMPEQGQDRAEFLTSVLAEVEDNLGDHLNGPSLIGIKALMQRSERDILASQNAAEALQGLERMTSGVVFDEMRKVRSGEKKHKL